MIQNAIISTEQIIQMYCPNSIFQSLLSDPKYIYFINIYYLVHRSHVLPVNRA